MDGMFISIGSQCISNVFFDNLIVKNETMPFDWMFSTPQFVYTILNLLLVEKKDIDYIVDNHFFVCDKKGVMQNAENHNTNGEVLVNSKYNVCFPHDTVTDRDKYCKRMESFKTILLNKDLFLNFVYISPPSSTGGNYMLDGIEPIQNLYENIEKINTVLKTTRTNFKIFIIDSSKPSNPMSSNITHVMHFELENKNQCNGLFPMLIN